MADAPALTRRALIAAAGLAAALAAAPLHAQEKREVVEMAMGSPDAPVTMIEYASFTCPHCAAFALEVMPQLKAQYVDTGKVRLVYREVYFDRPGLWASMIARCAGEDRYFGVAELLFKNQQSWAHAADAQGVLNGLFAIGRQAGMIDGEMQACMQDGEFAQALVTWFQGNATADKIDATPTFVLDGEKVTNMPWPEMQAKIEEKLAS
ncbi:DsbA family protein [Amaricoccus sp.]|uniref:DsbA family protein n=1 Tax=Amaricoccus sp. TaxID=1872485 RepID=UPI001B6C54CC|nr:DsbA family protein [Amaricoccus sp.]MBP7003234.1 DsbA family protein [Amaricoccus sp.]